MILDELFRKIESIFTHLWNSKILFFALFGFIVLVVVILITYGVLVYLDKKNPDVVTDQYNYIVANAPAYCKEQGFNHWKFIGGETMTSQELKSMENPKFECINVENQTKDIGYYYSS